MNLSSSRKLLTSILATTILSQTANYPALAESRSVILSEAPVRSKIIEQLCKTLRLKENGLISPCLNSMEAKIPQEETARIYASIWNAMSQATDKQQHDVNLLSWHILLALSDPTQINQGYHNTCALAALQSYIAGIKPSLLCDLTLQSRTGKLILPDGSKVILPEQNLSPDREAKAYHPGSAVRSYASQLFQIAAANAFWQHQKKDPRGIKVPLGSIQYVQDNPNIEENSRDTSERLFIRWSPDVTEHVIPQDSIWPGSSPSMTMEAIDKTYRLLTGRQDSPYLLAHREQHCTKPIIAFSNESQLRKKLTQLKEANAFPAIVSVLMSGCKASSTSRHCAGQFAETQPPRTDWHVVCIRDFDEQNQKVAIDNFWGPKSDHLGEDMISLHSLYSSSFPGTPEKENFGRMQLRANTNKKSKSCL